MSKKARFIAAAVLAVAACAVYLADHLPESQVLPTPEGTLSLRGKFVGPDAAGDAFALAGVAHAVADALEHDGNEATQRITTGLQLEDLRTGIAAFRFAPRPLRERQPHVRSAVGKYLDETAGTSGGPLDAEKRAAWIKAFREIAAAAEGAVR